MGLLYFLNPVIAPQPILWNKVVFMHLIIILFSLFISVTSLGVGTQKIPVIKKIGLLIASNKGAGMSSFGHAFIRISENEDWSKDDTIVEFVADDQGKGFQSIRDYIKGLGVGSSFNFKMNISKYSVVKENYNILENRDLTTYPLITTDDNRKQFYRILSQKSEKIDSENYAFLTHNCASQVSEILSETFQIDTKSSIPILLSSRFSEYIDQKNIVIDYSASSQRKNTLKIFLPLDLFPQDSVRYQNIVRQLISNNYNDRLIAFAKVLDLFALTNNQSLALFLNMYIRSENPALYGDLFKYINNPDERKNVKIITLDQDFNKLEVKDPGTIIPNPYNSNFEVEGTKLKIRYAINRNASSQDTHPTSRFIYIDLKSYGFTEDNGKIYYDKQLIFQKFNSDIFSTESHKTNILLRNEVVKRDGKNYLLPVLMIEKEGHKFTYSKANIDRTDTLPFANYSGLVANKNIILGNCLSMVTLQKILLEQVVFFPNYPKLTVDENENLLKEALRGNIVFAIGFSNINEWIKYIGENRTKAILTQLSYDLNISGYGDLMIKYFTRSQVTPENIDTIASALSLGVTVPVRFVVDEHQEHALLIYDIADRGDYYALAAYDPNVSINKLNDSIDIFKLSKKDGLFYSDLYMQSGAKLYIDKIDIETSINFKKSIQRKDMKKFLDFSIKEGRYSFTKSMFSI